MAPKFESTFDCPKSVLARFDYLGFSFASRNLLLSIYILSRNVVTMSFCTWKNDEHFRDHFKPGIYVCAECGYQLFSSRTKYEHHSPWPAFTETLHADSVSKVPEEGRENALKVSCGKCGLGLGHEFLKDGPNESSRF